MNGRDFADGQMFASRALVESFGYSYPIPVTSGLPVILPQWATANRERQGAHREPHDYCGRPVLQRMALWRVSGL